MVLKCLTGLQTIEITHISEKVVARLYLLDNIHVHVVL